MRCSPTPVLLKMANQEGLGEVDGSERLARTWKIPDQLEYEWQRCFAHVKLPGSEINHTARTHRAALWPTEKSRSDRRGVSRMNDSVL